MSEMIQLYFSWPILPFSVLLAGVCAYWILVIVSGLDLDFLDFDIDLDPGLDGHQSVLDWGLVGVRWLNLGDVPLMIWLSVFSLASWTTAVYFDKELVGIGATESVVPVLRNVGIGIVAVKLITQPLKGKLKVVEPNMARDLVGKNCVVTTIEATAKLGQARYETDNGAPLLLNIRTVDGVLPKGQIVEIVDYSEEDRVYFVRTARV